MHIIANFVLGEKGVSLAKNFMQEIAVLSRKFVPKDNSIIETLCYFGSKYKYYFVSVVHTNSIPIYYLCGVLLR